MRMREATTEDVADHPTMKVGEKMLDLIDEEWVRDGDTRDAGQLKKLKANDAKEAEKKNAERRYESIGGC